MNGLKHHTTPVLNEMRAKVLSYIRLLYSQGDYDIELKDMKRPEDIGIERALFIDDDEK